MSMRLYLTRCAESRLRSAEQNLRLVADLDQLHARASNDLARSGDSFSVLVRICWRAFCIERCVHHASRAEESRR